MIIPQTDIEQKRAAWWAAHFKPGMSRDDAFRLNEELSGLYPKTPEEREQKAKAWEGAPAFVL